MLPGFTSIARYQDTRRGGADENHRGALRAGRDARRAHIHSATIGQPVPSKSWIRRPKQTRIGRGEHFMPRFARKRNHRIHGIRQSRDMRSGTAGGRRRHAQGGQSRPIQLSRNRRITIRLKSFNGRNRARSELTVRRANLVACSFQGLLRPTDGVIAGLGCCDALPRRGRRLGNGGARRCRSRLCDCSPYSSTICATPLWGCRRFASSNGRP